MLQDKALAVEKIEYVERALHQMAEELPSGRLWSKYNMYFNVAALAQYLKDAGLILNQMGRK